jgi:hypothetical protein
MLTDVTVRRAKVGERETEREGARERGSEGARERERERARERETHSVYVTLMLKLIVFSIVQPGGETLKKHHVFHTMINTHFFS